MHNTWSKEPIIITMHPAHHGRYSGYDRLAHYLAGHVIDPIDEISFFQRGIYWLACKALGISWPGPAQFYAELRAMRYVVRGSGRLVHFLYGENSHRLLARWRKFWPKSKIICTYHYPEGKFRQQFEACGGFPKPDLAIAVSTVQLDFLRQWLSPEQILLIPHGVDIDFFCPAPERKPSHAVRCLFVGVHLRDFATLQTLVEFFDQPNSGIEFDIVTRSAYRPRFERARNVRFLSAISDRELLDLYQAADIFISPLLDSTANNALLEAMAGGLPIVCTDLPGIRDYLDETCAILVPKADADSMIEAVSTLAEDPECRSKMARASRVKALTFSWSSVASQLQQVYREQLNDVSPMECQ